MRQWLATVTRSFLFDEYRAEQLPACMLEEHENRNWVERNVEALLAHGEEISSTGLAGVEFERI